MNLSIERLAKLLNSLLIAVLFACLVTPLNALGVTVSLFVVISFIFLVLMPPSLTLIKNKSYLVFATAILCYAITDLLISGLLRNELIERQLWLDITLLFWPVAILHLAWFGWYRNALRLGLLLGTFWGVWHSVEALTSGRPQFTGGDYNTIYYGLVSVIYFLFWFIEAHVLAKSKRWLWAACCVFLGVSALIMLLASGGRGALVILPIAVFLYPFILFRNKKHATAVSLVALIGVIGLGGVVIEVASKNSMVQRVAKAGVEIEQYLNGQRLPTSVGLRLQFWDLSLDALAQSPITGVGREGLENLKVESIEAGRVHKAVRNFRHQHNDILNIGTLNGLVGIVSYLLIIMVPLWLSWKYRKLWPSLYLGSFVLALFVAGLTNSYLYSGVGAMLYFLLVTIFTSQLIYEDRLQQDVS